MMMVFLLLHETHILVLFLLGSGSSDFAHRRVSYTFVVSFLPNEIASLSYSTDSHYELSMETLQTSMYIPNSILYWTQESHSCTSLH